ncbi:MAG: M28 family peptidase [Planctomycetes bacterium]|nr:M28 family peptidase [Planctomycetota bacterium]
MPLSPELRRRLEEILACPTAPFAEGRVHAAIRAAVAGRKGLRESFDAFGNHLVVCGRGRPRLLFACHTDHPALLLEKGGVALIRGGMSPAQLEGAALRTLDGSRRGLVAGKKRKEGRIAVKGVRGLPPGTPLLLDLPDLRIRGGKIHSRVIDDLCAVAACLATADRLLAEGFAGSVGFLFTRAEEVGFAGALAWTRSTRQPRSTTIINLEMSNARPHTPQGRGPILRVGDRMTIFSQEVAAELEAVALEMKEKEGFRYQRALMDGGACEATVYAHAGFRTGALCLPLRNYHNHAARGGMGMEYVAAEDAENLVVWMTAYARRFGAIDAGSTRTRRLSALWARHQKEMRRTASEGRGG